MSKGAFEMGDIPVADRLAINDLVIAYATAVDSMGDVDAILDIFTKEAEFDLSSVGMACITGHAAIRLFYEGVFAANSHHAHYISNFAVTAYAGHTASARAYVIGMGRGKDGSAITVHGRYYFDVSRTKHGWKATRYSMDTMLPIG
jgi:ketosteroid isomerase-like protein